MPVQEIWRRSLPRHVVIGIQCMPFNAYLSIIVQTTEFFASLVQFIRREYLTLSNGGRIGWTVSVILDDGRDPSIVSMPDRTTAFGVQRRFGSVHAIETLLPGAIMNAYENLEQSKGRIPIDQIVFEVHFEREMFPAARGKIKSHILKSIASQEHTKGLAPYPQPRDLCGFRAIIYALTRWANTRAQWDGDLLWFNSLFTGPPEARQLLRGMKRFTNLATSLADQLGVRFPYDWQMQGDSPTAKQFVCMQPKFQIVIYNEVSRNVIQFHRGHAFDPDKAIDSTIMLTYTLGHLHLITSPYRYMTKSHSSYFCYCCLKFLASDHLCPDYAKIQCARCLCIFGSEAQLRNHMHNKAGWITCLRCNRNFYGEHCILLHNCSAANVDTCELCHARIRPYDPPHQCQNRTCSNCRKTVGDAHRCTIQRMKEPEVQTAEEAGRHYYAFDLEAMLIPGPNGMKHVVNLVCVQRCFSTESHLFYTMHEFIRWIEGLHEEITLFAHNLKGYDGRMVFDHLFDNHTPPQEVLWRGSKIMKMQYGKATFQDTLLHFPASLEQLPKMLGLDETQFKKGFFPYRFNVPENQDYVGSIPPVEMFDPGFMSTKKREEFIVWHADQTRQYNFRTELVEYCISDTKILAKSIEAYMVQQMLQKPLNPFSCTTVASYAMTLYRTYYMPEETIVRLTATEHTEISEAMHGGRTDVRRLLKEWSPEEVAQGLYGRYQDVQSLYPTVQFYDPMPVGVPVKTAWLINHQPQVSQIRDVFGFVCCDIEPTRYLHHPILVFLDPETGRLTADLLPRTRIVIPTPELHLAMDNGYIVTRVYWWYHFESSTDLFKGYMRDFLKDKLEASGVPNWAAASDEAYAEFETYHREELGIELHRDKMVPNAARKTGAKLKVNSLWGKFGERMKGCSWSTFQVDKDCNEINALEKRWIDGELDIVFRKYSHDNKTVGIVYNFNSELPPSHIVQRIRRGHRNIAIAAMITSHARCRLWKELNKLGDRVLYMDTDSIIYENSPTLYNIPLGRYLGEWECETGGNAIVKFVSTGTKSYCYGVYIPEANRVKYDTKVKGVTLHSANTSVIHFDSMKDLVCGDLENIAAQCLTFKYDRNAGTMITMTVLKLLKMTYKKGQIDETTWKIYPFGRDRFP